MYLSMYIYKFKNLTIFLKNCWVFKKHLEDIISP